MTSDTKNEETKLTYDERRKILNQKKSQVTENKKDAVVDGEGNVTEPEKLISTVKQSMEVDYTEDGIRLAHENLTKEKAFLKERSAQLTEQFEKIGEMPADLKELKEKLADIAKYDASEKAKEEHEAIQERMKDNSKDLKELEDEIGTRLKF